MKIEILLIFYQRDLHPYFYVSVQDTNIMAG